MRVDKGGVLEKSTDVTNLLADDFSTAIETTVSDASCLNGNNEQHNIIINNIGRTGILDSNQHKKWCFSAETPAEVHRFKLQSTLDNNSPHFSWYGKNTSINELRTFGCYIYSITSLNKN